MRTPLTPRMSAEMQSKKQKPDGSSCLTMSTQMTLERSHPTSIPVRKVCGQDGGNFANLASENIAWVDLQANERAWTL